MNLFIAIVTFVGIVNASVDTAPQEKTNEENRASTYVAPESTPCDLSKYFSSNQGNAANYAMQIAQLYAVLSALNSAGAAGNDKQAYNNAVYGARSYGSHAAAVPVKQQSSFSGTGTKYGGVNPASGSSYPSSSSAFAAPQPTYPFNSAQGPVGPASSYSAPAHGQSSYSSVGPANLYSVPVHGQSSYSSVGPANSYSAPVHGQSSYSSASPANSYSAPVHGQSSYSSVGPANSYLKPSSETTYPIHAAQGSSSSSGPSSYSAQAPHPIQSAHGIAPHSSVGPASGAVQTSYSGAGYKPTSAYSPPSYSSGGPASISGPTTYSKVAPKSTSAISPALYSSGGPASISGSSSYSAPASNPAYFRNPASLSLVVPSTSAYSPAANAGELEGRSKPEFTPLSSIDIPEANLKPGYESSAAFGPSIKSTYKYSGANLPSIPPSAPSSHYGVEDAVVPVPVCPKNYLFSCQANVKQVPCEQPATAAY